MAQAVAYVPTGARHADELRAGLVVRCAAAGLTVEVTSDVSYARAAAARGVPVVVAHRRHRRDLLPDVRVLDVRLPRQRAVVAAAAAVVVAWLRERPRVVIAGGVAAGAAGLVAIAPVLLPDGGRLLAPPPATVAPPAAVSPVPSPLAPPRPRPRLVVVSPAGGAGEFGPPAMSQAPVSPAPPPAPVSPTPSPAPVTPTTPPVAPALPEPSPTSSPAAGGDPPCLEVRLIGLRLAVCLDLPGQPSAGSSFRPAQVMKRPSLPVHLG